MSRFVEGKRVCYASAALCAANPREACTDVTERRALKKLAGLKKCRVKSCDRSL